MEKKLSTQHAQNKEVKSIKNENNALLIPEEIWIEVFSYFGFTTLQNVLTLVCKEWLRVIRNSFRLSGRLNVRPGTQLEDVNSMLKTWQEIKVLQVEKDVKFEHLNVKTCAKLEKVLIYGCFSNDEFNHILPE